MIVVVLLLCLCLFRVFFLGGIKFSVYMFNDNLKIKITYRSPLI